MIHLQKSLKNFTQKFNEARDWGRLACKTLTENSKNYLQWPQLNWNWQVNENCSTLSSAIDWFSVFFLYSEMAISGEWNVFVSNEYNSTINIAYIK